MIIGELKIWLIDGLRLGLVFSIDFINWLSSYEYRLGILANDPLTIFKAKNCKLLAVKGGERQHISNKRAPSDQISVLNEYGLLSIISGDR